MIAKERCRCVSEYSRSCATSSRSRPFSRGRSRVTNAIPFDRVLNPVSQHDFQIPTPMDACCHASVHCAFEHAMGCSEEGYSPRIGRSMRDYVKSRDFHRHMRSLLASRFQELGWKSQTGKCSFARGRRVCWLQISQHSNSVLGSKFTINMTQGSGPAGDTRILRRLNEEDRAIGKDLEERIIARLPRPDPDPEVEVVGEDGGTLLVKLGDLVRANPKQWDAPSDVWLPYFSKSDLDDWAAFLLPRLDRLTASSSSEMTDALLWVQRLRRLTGLFRSR
ncbi:hypothetical protein ACVITL_005472 [Rhizobium pisi]